MKKIVVVFLFFGISICLFSQQKILSVDRIVEIGDSLSRKKDFKKGIQYYERASKMLEKDKDWKKETSLTLKIVNNYYSLKLAKPALNLLEKSLVFSRGQISELDTLKAMVYHKIGVGHYLIGEFYKEIEFYKKALNIRRKILKPSHPDVIRGFNNIGISYNDLGVFDSAEFYLKSSLNLQKLPYTDFINDTYLVLGEVYEYKGEYDKAENCYITSLEISKKLQHENWRIANEHLRVSRYFFNVNQPHQIINHGLKAIYYYNLVEKKYSDDYIGIAKSYMNIGLAYQKLNDFEKAIIHIKKAFPFWEKGKDSIDFADAYFNLGNTYKKAKDFEKALFFLEKALKSFSNQGNFSGIYDTYNNLGDLYYDQTQYKKALTHYHQSLPYLLKNFQEQDQYKNPILKDHYIPDKQALLVFLEAKAKTFKALYDQNHQEKDLKAAHQTYQLLDELIDDIRLSYLEDASKSYLVKQAKPIYEKAIGICLQYHQYSQDKKYLTEAFKYAEKSKAIILLEQIKESKANIAASIPDSLRQKERQLKKEIGQIERDLALQGEEVITDSLGKSLREKLIRVKNDYEDLVKNLEKENAEYHQLKYDLQTVDIETIQTELLKEGQQLVEYFVGVDSMYLFSIGKEKFEIIASPLDFDLKAWTDSLRQGIYYCRINSEVTKKDCQTLDRQYEQYAAKLYQKLIAPLNLTAETKEIIFIPDGVLGYIPFDALLTKVIPVNQQNQFNRYPYFGLEKVMSYAFSATFLKELQQTTSTIDNHQLLAFAPSFKVSVKEGVTLKITPSEEAQDPILVLRSSLNPLLFNEREVEQIEVNFSGKSYLHQQANKASFMQEASNYRYLHIASHGKMNDADADLSYIAFTQDGDSTNQDELLYLRELYDMDIPADMVVLSACETGIGELQNGEGIISLARGFSYAGAKSIITSLWSVNDQKTTDLMVDFYQNLKEGETKAYALANAKRDYITAQKSATFSHPFYWAGFIPIGNMDSVQAATDWTWFAYGLAGMSLLGGFILWQSKRTKRKSSPIAA